MHRDISYTLTKWKQSTHSTPLLVRGARQVGKSYLIEQFGKTHFKECITINFEQTPEFNECFKTLNPNDILNDLQVLTNKSIVPNQTLIFLDEIQECPRAIMALRYFKEQRPDIHIIGAGSLLELALQQPGFSMPVGRVQYLYVKPLSFGEYLTATDKHNLREQLEKYTPTSPPSTAIHQLALKLVKEYMTLGGMPEVIRHYNETKNLLETQQIQNRLVTTYQDDFAKYAQTTEINVLKTIFTQTPKLLGQQIKYVNIDQNCRSTKLKQGIEQLQQAGVINKIYSSEAQSYPLTHSEKPNKFKLLYLDIGLAINTCNLTKEVQFNEDIFLLNRGSLAEQFVGQELLAYQDPFKLEKQFFWFRDKTNSQAEVDYILQINDKLIPAEVKAGKSGRLKSLHLFLNETKSPLGIQISQKPLSTENNILCVPLYMVEQLPRLIEEQLSK